MTRQYAISRNDCGITPEQLIELAKAGPHAADEMIEMMRALSIDPTEVQLRFRNQFRDMQINCSHCASKGECRKDLKIGSAPEHFIDYCANADELNALRRGPASSGGSLEYPLNQNARSRVRNAAFQSPGSDP